MNCNLTDRRVDGGYGWMVVIASLCLIIITDGIFFSFGNMLVELLEQFDQDRASTSLIGSVMFGISALIGIASLIDKCGIYCSRYDKRILGPFSGGLCHRFGCRIVAVVGAGLSCVSLIISTFATSFPYLYISYGVFGGTGLGCMYLSANVIAVQYFYKHRGLACGITLCGSGIGTFVFNLFTRYLINEYGWRGTLLIEAGMCIQGVVFGLLLLPPIKRKETKIEIKTYNCDDVIDVSEQTIGENEHNIEVISFENEVLLRNTIHSVNEMSIEKDNFEMKNKSDNKHKPGQKATKQRKHWSKRFLHHLFDIELLANSKLWIFLSSTFIANLAYSVVIVMSVDRAVESGLTKYEASWLASSIGITSAVSRVLLGWLADRIVVSKIVMLFLLMFLAGLSTVLSVLLRTFATTIVYTSLYGFFTGGYIAICPTVLADLFSVAMIAKSFGLYMFVIGIASTAATPIAGFLYDKTGNYDVTFIVAGTELMVAGLLVLILRFIHVKKRNV